MEHQTWDDEALGWDSVAEALEAMRACLNADIGAVLLVWRDDSWEEATAEDVEAGNGPWQIMDEGGNTVLVPKGRFDANESWDDLEAPVPEGLVWIVP